MKLSLSFLSGIPLMVMAAALLVLAMQRLDRPAPVAAPAPSFGDLLVNDGRLDEALDWYGGLARDGDPAALRQLISVADLAGESGQRATALQRLVRSAKATLAEHIATAEALAAAGALKDALTVLYNAERRFPAELDARFLSLYAALARDNGRPDVALPLARRLWKKSGDNGVLRLMIDLGAG